MPGCAAVEMSERHADGLIDEPQREAIAAEVEEYLQLRSELRNREADVLIEQAAACLIKGDLIGTLLNTWIAGFHRRNDWRILIRDLFPGTPELVSINPAWKNWNDGVVEKVARTIYDEGRFEELPILADALEEAGCDQAALLAHLRSADPHYRGCWALDAILDRP